MNDTIQQRRRYCRLPYRRMAVGAALCVTGGILSRAAGGSPYVSWMTERFPEEFSSLTLTAMTAAWLVWYALLGAGLAFLLSGQAGSAAEEYRLRTAIPYISMLYIGYLWYPVFFREGWLYLSFVICLAALALCGLAFRSALSVCRGIRLLLLLHGIWLLWLTAKSACLLFRQ